MKLKLTALGFDLDILKAALDVGYEAIQLGSSLGGVLCAAQVAEYDLLHPELCA